MCADASSCGVGQVCCRGTCRETCDATAGGTGGDRASAGGFAGGAAGGLAAAGGTAGGAVFDGGTVSCGPAAKRYGVMDNAYAGALCIGGDPDLEPGFPAQGQTSGWRCTGASGVSVSCEARRDDSSQASQCGTAARAYSSMDTTFDGTLCAVGAPSPAAPAFPPLDGSTRWQCTGAQGDVVSCTASRGAARVDGSCGPAATSYPATAAGFSGAPCATGLSTTPPVFPAAGQSSTWTCAGQHGGVDATCTASRLDSTVNGLCGNAAQAYPSGALSFAGALCANGTPNPATPTFPAEGAFVSWRCEGAAGGATATCTATRGAARVDGLCGNAATTYGAMATAFAGSFCAAGSPSPTLPTFPAQGATSPWTCLGTNGGTSASCQATRLRLPQDGTCGAAASSYPDTAMAFSGALCAIGTPMPASVAFPAMGATASWSCLGQFGGTTASCTASRGAARVNGACGNAATAYPAAATSFSGSLCASGTPSPALPAFPGGGASATWSCLGLNGGTTASCTATRALPVTNGACGPAATTYAAGLTTFAGAFCTAGTASPAMPGFPVVGGSVTWSCLGANGGSTANACTATRQVVMVSGLCGQAARSYFAAETSFVGSLCAQGSTLPATPAFPSQGATTTWQCAGSGGGSTADCSASRAATVNGVCGTAATTWPASSTAFSGSFCQSGTPMPTTPAFPATGGLTTWTCTGANGGMNASCTATRATPPIVGVCGSAATGYPASAVSYNGAFCVTGLPMPSTPAFPANGATVLWTCEGSGGGATATCSATRALAPITGACGPAATTYLSTATTFSGALCSNGTASPPVVPFPAAGASVSWLCLGANNGSDASCTASRGAARVDGVCGNAVATYPSTATGWSGTFCSAGNASPSAPAFPAAGTSVNWSCVGLNGGATAACSAQRDPTPQPGQCGPAASTYAATATAFSGALCAVGSPSPSSVAFPASGQSVTWTCEGRFGGSAATCTASRGAAPITGVCGNAATSYPFGAMGFLGSLCSAGTASPASPPFPTVGGVVTWTCTGANGGASSGQCLASRALAPIDGACGPAASSHAATATTFMGALCSSGTAAPAAPVFPQAGLSVTWSCLGSNGGSSTNACTATRAPIDGLCGPAQRSYTAADTAFSGALCLSGTAAPASVSFPAEGATASWQCVGSTNGSSSTCSATRSAAPVNGQCGTAASTYAHSASGFTGSFCAAGSADPVSPPFPPAGGSTTWSCLGANGGSASPTCVATRAPVPVDGACGSAATTYAPSTTSWAGPFCVSGTPSPASPTFPAPGATASWSCLGQSGGTTSPPCTATRLAPLNGACGPASRSYPFDAMGFTGAYCTAGDLWPGSMPFPPPGAAVTWECRGTNGGTTDFCGATRAPTPQNAACGPAAQVYPVGATTFSGSFCNPGTVASTPTFPAAGSSASWTCNGIAGGMPITCTAISSANGACGDAARPYLATEPAFAGAFCQGPPPTSAPTFPAPGASSSWQCPPVGLGLPLTCSASRGLPLPSCTIGLDRASGPNGLPFKLTWSSNATSCTYTTTFNGTPGSTLPIDCSGISATNLPSLTTGGTASWTLFATGPNGTSQCSTTYTVTSETNAVACYLTIAPRTVSASSPVLILWSSPASSCAFTLNGGSSTPIGCSGNNNSPGSTWGVGTNVFSFSPTPGPGQTAATCVADFTVTP